MNETIHLLVVRLGVYWEHSTLKKLNISWEDYINDRLRLYNTITRPSIVSQSDQNFTVILLVDEKIVNKYTTVLDNERIEIVERDESGQPHRNIVKTIKNVVKNYGKDGYKNVIVSRLDSDDLIHEDYISEVKFLLPEKFNNIYIDIAKSITYDINTGRVYESGKYNQIISPFVSVKESINNYKAINLAYDHSEVNKYVNGGFKSKSIKAIQVIHDHNMINKIGSEDITAKFPFYQYGSYFS